MRWWRRISCILGCVPIIACGGQSTSHHSPTADGGSSAGTNPGGSGASGGSGGSGAWSPGESWTLQPGDPSDDQAYGVGVDASDNVYVLRVRGLEADAPTPILEKYGQSGQLIWKVEISETAPALLAVQGNGTSVLAGTTSQTDATGAVVINKVVLTAYDASGSHRWTTVLDEEDLVAVLALNVDVDGHIFVLWTEVAIREANNNVFCELDDGGNPLFTTITSDPGTAYASAIDPRGNLLEAGGASDHFARAHDPRGNDLWTTLVDGNPTALSGDQLGNALVVGLLPNGRGRLTRLDAYGNHLFDVDFGNEAEFTRLVVGDALRRTYTVGTVTSDRGDRWDVQARRFDVSGSALGAWSLGSAQIDQPLAVATDSTGALLVVGLTHGAFPGHTSAGGIDSFVARIPTE